MEEKTVLYDWHVQHGGRMVPFAGYLLPVQYESGVIAEHMAVRERAGLFDVSHMAEILVSGPGALDAVQRLVTVDCAPMSDGRVKYALMCNESGGIVDDLVVCRLDASRYLLVVNAANHAKDLDWIISRVAGSAIVEDVSDKYAQIALQGPKSRDILARLADADSIPTKYYTLVERGLVGGIHSIVSRTGYTGEDGYELYCAPGDSIRLWELLMETGREYGLIPCGLGSRDTLRLEAAMPLYGHEMTDSITPFEAGLASAVQMDKADFVGRAALAARIVPERVRVGLKMTGHGIARGGESVSRDGTEVGSITSGSWCPFMKTALAMALVCPEAARPGLALDISIRGKPIAAEVIPLPFYSRSRR